jgi:hypothetical protein
MTLENSLIRLDGIFIVGAGADNAVAMLVKIIATTQQVLYVVLEFDSNLSFNSSATRHKAAHLLIRPWKLLLSQRPSLRSFSFDIILLSEEKRQSETSFYRLQVWQRLPCAGAWRRSTGLGWETKQEPSILDKA